MFPDDAPRVPSFTLAEPKHAPRRLVYNSERRCTKSIHTKKNKLHTPHKFHIEPFPLGYARAEGMSAHQRCVSKHSCSTLLRCKSSIMSSILHTQRSTLKWRCTLDSSRFSLAPPPQHITTGVEQLQIRHVTVHASLPSVDDPCGTVLLVKWRLFQGDQSPFETTIAFNEQQTNIETSCTVCSPFRCTNCFCFLQRQKLIGRTRTAGTRTACLYRLKIMPWSL